MTLQEIKNAIRQHMQDACTKEVGTLELLGSHQLLPFDAKVYILKGSENDPLAGWSFYYSRHTPAVLVLNRFLLSRASLKKIYTYSQLIGVIAHESLHIVTAILREQKIKDIEESEELFCYLLQNLVEKIIKIINK